MSRHLHGVRMRPGGPSRVVLAGIAAVVLAVGPWPLASATHVALGASGPELRGTTNGSNGCAIFPPFTRADCQQWNLDSGAAASWNVTPSKTFNRDFYKNSSAADIKMSEVDGADGSPLVMSLSATLTVHITGGGRSDANASFSAGFSPHTASMTISGTASWDGKGTALVSAGGSVRVDIGCESSTSVNLEIGDNGGAGDPESSGQQSISGTVDSTKGDCSVSVSASANGATNQPGSPDENGLGKATVDVTVVFGTPGPIPTPGSGCDLKGVVRDGHLAPDGHDNPLVGVPVELVSNGTPVGAAAVTGSDGSYCLPAGLVTPGDFQLRASLVDGEHTPPVFVTRHEGSDDPVDWSQDVHAEDFGRQDLDLTFAATADEPWLADVANIHWQSRRFVDWLLDVLVLDPTQISGLVIKTGASISTQYKSANKTVFIQASDTPYSQRQRGTSECPENCEWHEIGHHVANLLGIGPFAAPACASRVNHGGWLNPSTCDSVAEGFPNFLATLASLDIDRGQAGGYGDARYSVFGSLEDNGFQPWSMEGSQHREDFAVAQLLWDLADDTPTETIHQTFYTGSPPASSKSFKTATLKDRVALSGLRLIQLLTLDKPATVADIHDSLTADPGVPTALKTRDVDVDGDGAPDLSPLEEVFVAHGFTPARVLGAWHVGDPIGQTQPGSTNLLIRRHEETIEGSAIRLRNRTSGPVTMTIQVTYPSTSTSVDVDLAAGVDSVVHLELPPYWSGLLPPDGTLPDCSLPSAWPVTVTVSAPGIAPRAVSSCEYFHLVATATNGAAFTFDDDSAVGAGASAAPIPSAATTDSGAPLGMIAIVGAGIAAIAVGLVLSRRRRRMSE